MIMSTRAEKLQNRIKVIREQRGWSQADLAARCGVSRSEVSAIETGRLTPSTATALRLASAMACTVEQLFTLEESPAGHEVLPWASAARSERFWVAEVAGTRRRYAVEPLVHGSVESDESLEGTAFAADTIVLATCDPAVSLLGRRLEARGLRCLALPRPSRCALRLLKAGVVDAAAVHLGSDSAANARIAYEILGDGFAVVRLARWEEGLAFAGAPRTRALTAKALARLRWVGRAPGSGARQCSDALLENPARSPRGYDHHAPDHRAVASAIATGWAEVGVCVRLAAQEAGLGFTAVSSEALDLCVRADQLETRKISQLVAVLQSPDYRRALGGLPGYDATNCGDVAFLNPRSV